MSESSGKPSDVQRKSDKRGILRLDISKPRNSAGSVEFRNQPELHSETTPSPQPTLLSVKWASSNDNEYELQLRKDRLSSFEKRPNKSLSADYFGYQPYPDQNCQESFDNSEYLNSEDEDYSFSISRVIHRRASSRRKGYHSPRRTSTSSQMAHINTMSGNSANIAKGADRRRSSVYTTSSGETGISMGGDGGANNNHDSTKEQIFENIRLHKEVLQSVKMQPWSMRRKLRLVRQAREYIARHEGALQERFAMSRSTRDLWARFKIVLAVKWQHFRRELLNFSTIFVPWQLRIKEIESHFGSVVASYFTFLRWLFWVNIVLAFTLSTFVILPEFLASQYSGQDDHRKVMMTQESENATRLTTFLNFEGYLKYSPLFYGYYSDYSGIVRQGYNLPLAYFFAGVAVYIYSFWATLRKMADNSRMSKMSSKEDECIFSWKLFTGWDYMIGHAETAHNRIASVVLGFKEALLEEAEKKKDKQNWKVIVLRVIVNILILCLLVLSASAVVIVVERSSDQTKNYSYWRRNETSFVMTGISFFFPMCFEFLGYLENYHPRKQLRWQLGRIMLLNLLNLFSLIIALFKKIYLMNMELERLRQCPSKEESVMNSTMQSYTTTDDSSSYMDAVGFYNIFQTATSELFTNFLASTTPASTLLLDSVPACQRVLVNCTKPASVTSALVTSMLLLNFTSTIFPEIVQQSKINNFSSATFSSTAEYDATNATEWYEQNFTNPYETTTEMSVGNSTEFDFVSTPDDYYEYDENSNSGQQARFQRDVNNPNYPYYEYDDDPKVTTNAPETIDNAPETIGGDPDYTDSSDYDGNFTQILSSTVSSFLDNFTQNSTFDLSNETYVSEAWTEYLTTFATDMPSTTEATNDYTTTSNQFDELEINEKPYEIDENGNCYVVVCDAKKTTSATSEASERFELTAFDDDYTDLSTEMSSIASSIQPMLEHFNASELNASNVTAAQMCVPFRRSNADNITGIPPEYVGRELRRTINKMNEEDQLELRDLCWETLFGQELVKLTVLDLIFTIITTLFMDFFRALFVRFMNKFWCWDLEKKWPKYGDFKIAENILHLVNNQGQVWMGMFFSPGLAILNLIKLGILMYFRSWAVLTCNVPHEVVFRASRSNNFYLALLLTMLFLCVLPVSYAIVWIEPSWHCGPFANHARIHRVFTDTLRRTLPKTWHLPMDIIASPSTVIPLLLLLSLIIYYLISLTGALREANQDLKNQLRRERQEERRKMLQRVVNAKLDDGGGNNAIDRWRKVLEASSPVTPSLVGQQSEPDEEKLKARRQLLARIMKKALRKSSNTSEEESRAEPYHNGDGDGDEDGTDTEQNEQLPHDQEVTVKRSPPKRKNSTVQLVDDKKVDRPRRKMSLSHVGETKTRKVIHGAENRNVNHERKGNDAAEKHDEHEDKISVVSERRALRRQRNTRESDGSISVQTGLGSPDAIHTDDGAQRNEPKSKDKKETEKKSTKVQNSPNFFRFDSDTNEKELEAKQMKNTDKRLRNVDKEAETINKEMGNMTKVSRNMDEEPKKVNLDKESKKINIDKEPTSADKVMKSMDKESKNADKALRHAGKGAIHLDNESENADRSVINADKEFKGTDKPLEYTDKEPKNTDKEPKNADRHQKNADRHQKNADNEPKNTHKGKPAALNFINEARSPSSSRSKESSSQESVEIRSPKQSTPETPRSADDLLKQPMKKINSFISLVREAVQPKHKVDHPPEPDIVAVPSNDLQLRCKHYIDDSNPVLISEDCGSIKTTDSITSSSSSKVTYFEATRRKHRSDPPKPKRRDSQASIWSEIIPVIRISKSESDECILERDAAETESAADQTNTPKP